MSSETSTDLLQPWQFFVLAGLASATAAVFIRRGQGLTPIVLAPVLMGAAALVGLAALRMLHPLVSGSADRTPMVGERTRAALEREKMLALRALKELEFDRAMGKLSDADWREMSGRLRARAARLMRQLDAGAGYRAEIERELAARLGNRSAAPPAPPTAAALPARPAEAARRSCGECATVNDADARFCKRCGAAL